MHDHLPQVILSKARTSWLTKTEILLLLDFGRKNQHLQASKVPFQPQSGCVFIYNRESLEKYKKDGHDWKKKKGSTHSVREDHVKLKIGRAPRLYACYVHSENVETFRRRSYMDLNDPGKNTVLVHYLDTNKTNIQHDQSCPCLGCTLPAMTAKTNRSHAGFPVKPETYEHKLHDAQMAVGPFSSASPDLDYFDEHLIAELSNLEYPNDDQLLQGSRAEDPFAVRGEQQTNKFKVIDIVPKRFLIGGSGEALCMMCLAQVNGEFVRAGCIPPRAHLDVQVGEHTRVVAEEIAPGVVRFQAPKTIKPGSYEVQLLVNGEPCIPNMRPSLAFVAAAHPRLGSPHSQFPPHLRRGISRLKRKSMMNQSSEIGAENNGVPVNMDSFLSTRCDDDHVDSLEDDELSELSEVLLERVVRMLVDLADQEQDLQSEVDVLDDSGYNLLHYTIMYGHPKLVKTLLDFGADPNKPTHTGDCPLHLAAEVGNVDIVDKILASKLANPVVFDAQGRLPSQIASKNGHQRLSLKMARFDGGRMSICEGDESNDTFHGGSPISMGSWSGYPSDGSTNTSVRDNKHVQLLRDALGQMSLKDKCALTLSVCGGENMLVSAAQQSDDVRSIVSENESSVRAAMRVMGDDEREQLQEEARIIQSNFRRWMLRKNFQEVRHATRRLQKVTKGFLARKAYKKDRISSGVRTKDASPHLFVATDAPMEVIQLQAATRGVLARKQFHGLRKQLSASLVIQKSVRAHQQRKKLGDCTTSSGGHREKWGIPESTPDEPAP